MTVIESKILEEGRRSSWNGIDHSYTLIWQIKTDSAADDVLEVYNDAVSTISGFQNPLPVKYATYSHGEWSDGSAYAKQYEWSNPSPKLWQCAVTFNRLMPNEDPSRDGTNPSTWATRWRRTYVKRTRVRHSAILRDPKAEYPTGLTFPDMTIGNQYVVVNAANDIVDDKLEETYTNIVMVAEKAYSNLAAIDAVIPYVDHINSATFQGQAVHTVRFDEIRDVGEQRYNGQSYIITHLYFEVNAIGKWYDPVPNVGRRHVVAGVKRDTYTDGDGNAQPIITPVNLDFDGSKLADNIVPKNIYWQVPGEANFNDAALGL